MSHVDEVIIHLTIDGERIFSMDGVYGTVEAVEVIEDADQPMYNLTVEEA